LDASVTNPTSTQTFTATNAAGFDLDSVDSNQKTVRILQNNFADGDLVTYNANGNTPITNLVSGTTYKIHVIDEDNFQLLDGSGNPIAVSQSSNTLGAQVFTDKSLQIASVDSTNHTINIAHNDFAEGDQLTYNANGNTVITGLTSGTTY